MCVLSLQSCPTVAHQAPLSIGILQTRILEWVVIPSSRGSSQPRDQTQVSCIAGGFFTIWATREAPDYEFPCCSEENVVMVDYGKQRRLQGRFWKINSISIDTFLYSSSPLTNNLYHPCLFPQFPFGLQLTATHILPVVLERVSSDPKSQIQGVCQSLVHCNVLSPDNSFILGP